MNTNKKVIITEVIAIVAVLLLGTLFHNLYEWTENDFLAIISPVNESKWEHIKIMFYPYLLIGAIEYLIIGKDTRNFVFGKTLGVITLIIATFGLIQLAELFTDEPSTLFHIIAYAIGIIIAQYVSYKVITDKEYNGCTRWISYVIIIIVIGIITYFTYRPLKIDFFMDQETMTYGIPEKE